jgi:hypothetical protein
VRFAGLAAAAWPLTAQVASGAAVSLARPGGNATGFTLFETTMGGKWLSLLKEVRPGLNERSRRA